ncbi:MAG: hypothetical protein ACXAC8_13585 [Candidatus Hodarchaeales archaeon]|jgi:hypothetical protein
MNERTSNIEKLRYELESSVDINIDTINGLYELVDVLIEQIQFLQEDVKALAEILVGKTELSKETINKINNMPNKEIYI